MAIPISTYVDITSGVGGSSQVPTRNLGGLIITGNNLVPTGEFLTFTSAAAVGNYFGTDSEEYQRAVFYFGWISKSISQPQALSFYFWNANADTHDLIFGAPPIDLLAAFNSITAGQLDLTMGGFTHTLTSINLSGAGSLAAVATDIQTAIQAYSSGGAAWTAATVTYDASSGAFNLVSGTAGADTIAVVAAGSNDLAGPLGWLNAGTIISQGQAALSITAMLNGLINETNDFGSFLFTNDLAVSITNIEAAATWNNSLTPNIQFIYTVQVTSANASAWAADLDDIGGVTLTLQSPGAAADSEFPEMVPMMILAATDYTQPNTSQNYEFQQFNLTPSVDNPTDYATYTGLSINFYGQTQTAGQLINFYQQGVMMGLPVDPLDQNTYANEIWFKDALGASLMNLLLALTQVPANNLGISQVLAIIQSVIVQALRNGTIQVGRTLDATQKLYITQQTGSNTAWQQVQNAGYWVGAEVQTYTVGSNTEYKIVYTLVYAKDDVVRLITGSNVLI